MEPVGQTLSNAILAQLSEFMGDYGLVIAIPLAIVSFGLLVTVVMSFINKKG